MRKAILLGIAILVTNPCLAADAAKAPAAGGPAVSGSVRPEPAAPAVAPAAASAPGAPVAVAPVTATELQTAAAVTATVVGEPAAPAKKPKKDRKKRDRRHRNEQMDFDYGAIFLPVKRQYVVEDLSTGKFSLADQDYRGKAGSSFFMSFGKREQKKGKRLYSRWYAGFGYAGASYSMAGTERVTRPDATPDRNLRRDEDRIDDEVSSLILAMGAGKGFQKKDFDAFLGWRLGFWPTMIGTKTVDAIWPGDGSGAVKLVNRDTKYILLGDFGLVLDVGLIRVGGFHLGLDGRLGYIGSVKYGTDPNPDIRMVGVTPDQMGMQFALGGTYWYAGLKIY